MFFLEDEKIGLRALEENDVDGPYAEWLNDEVCCRFNSHHKYPVNKCELLKYISQIEVGRDAIVMAMIAKREKLHIGNIALQKIDFLNGQAEIAFLIGNKDYWNKGYATRAGKLLLEHAFMELRLNRVYFGTNKENMGMQKVGEYLGFHMLGVSRQALYKNGKFHDIIHFDLLKDEWERN